jgi:hypothetical protein
MKLADIKIGWGERGTKGNWRDQMRNALYESVALEYDVADNSNVLELWLWLPTLAPPNQNQGLIIRRNPDERDAVRLEQ